jgi:hypothetical protein
LINRISGKAGAALTLAVPILLAACQLTYPEVVVVNRTAPNIIVKNPSFNGCIWETVIEYGQATSPGRCLPGRDRVHFQKYDAYEYCFPLQGDGGTGQACLSDGGMGTDGGLPEPMWFNYQTVSVRHAGSTDFEIFEITLDDMEQDFSIPGPYGH